MARFTVLRICVCAVLLCLVFVNDVDAKKGFSFGRRKSGGASNRRTGQQQHKPPPPPPQHTANTHFLDAERNPKPQTNTGPIGFQPSGGKPQTNTAPIGFEHFQNPGTKTQTPIGFESFNKKPNSPSAPAMPVPPPNAPAMPNTNIGFNQPVGGSSFPSNQYPGKVNNPYQTNPNYAWDSHSNPQFKPSNNYPNTGYPNPGYQHSGYPNSGFSNPSQPFGNNYYNPNTGYPSFPNNYFGGSHYSAPNSFGNSHFGNSFNPHGNNYFPGGGYGHGGYGGYPGQFGYNNYKPKSKFGFGGLPLPIPIPIPIPLGGFGSWGMGSRRSENSHHVLNSLQNTTSLNSTSNATSIYVVNNVTVVSCTNELFSYGPVNLTVTTCTADNCTSVKVYTAHNSTVNHWTLTMCVDPNVTVTTNSSNARNKAEVTNVSKYWQTVCGFSSNTTSNGIETNMPTQNMTTPVVSTSVWDTNLFRNTTSLVALNVTGTKGTASLKPLNSTGTANYTVSMTSVNATGNVNVTNRLCDIVSCAYVSMCLPETAIDNSTRTSYRPCIRVKMCKSPRTPITHHVTLNTTAVRHYGVNKTETYSLSNITVLAFYPVRNNCSTNSTTCLSQVQLPKNIRDYPMRNNCTTNSTCYVVELQPPTNTTGYPTRNNCTTNSTCCVVPMQPPANTSISGLTQAAGESLCNTTVAGNSDNLELAELKQRIDKLHQLDTELKNRT